MRVKYSEVWAKAPASIANLGPGFDRAAISFPHFWDHVWIRYLPDGNILSLGADSQLGGTPNDPQKNIVTRAAEAVLKAAGLPGTVCVTLRKGVPTSSGLGSSAASAVAAVLATAKLFDGLHNLSRAELLAIAGSAEALASGEPHFDNAGASLHGGFVSVGALGILEPEQRVGARVFHDLPPWGIAVVTPRVRGITTREARECLPQDCDAFWIKVGMNSIRSIANFWNAIAYEDIEWFAKTVNSEDLITPYRLELYGKAKYEAAIAEAKRVAFSGGWACGVGLAGAGPSLFAIAETGRKAFTCGLAMKTVLEDADLYLSEMCADGAEIVSTTPSG